MAIYTKKGDKGETKVFDKKTGKLVVVSKNSKLIRTIGSIDELNSWLGVVNSGIGSEMWDVRLKNKYIKIIGEIQRNLFVVNSILAGSNLKLTETAVKKLERDIDDWEGILPVQKNFIYYGGNKIASQIFYARALCRRAERCIVSHYSKLPTTDYRLLTYINRLSDYLFMLARLINFELKVKEEYWIGNKDR